MEHDMSGGQQQITRILFIDNDELSFEFRKCMARVINSLPPMELFHAHDATEALNMLESLHPDVVILDSDSREENSLFLDSLVGAHPPIVVLEDEVEKVTTRADDGDIRYLKKNDSIEGIHQTLLVASELGSKEQAPEQPKFFH